MGEKTYFIEIIQSDRKSFSLEIKSQDKIICRAPDKASRSDIDGFIESHRAWLEKHLKKLSEAETGGVEREALSENDIKLLKKRAKEYIPQRAEFFSNQMGIKYGNITIRLQKTRWGSCSSKGNINFNCLLMLTDIEIIDYVVVHELCHLKQMNHSEEFWKEVEKVLPDYKERKKRLKQIERSIMQRIG